MGCVTMMALCVTNTNHGLGFGAEWERGIRSDFKMVRCTIVRMGIVPWREEKCFEFVAHDDKQYMVII